eukprot:4200956-Pleurochrysis_carterae.AAC.1
MRGERRSQATSSNVRSFLLILIAPEKCGRTRRVGLCGSRCRFLVCGDGPKARKSTSVPVACMRWLGAFACAAVMRVRVASSRTRRVPIVARVRSASARASSA